MRTEKKLLKLLKDNIFLMGDRGMCTAISLMYKKNIITSEERFKLRIYLKNKKPKEKWGSGFWFEPGKIEPRINWLNKQL